MPMVKCPECGKKMSSQANACPRCGYVLDDAMRARLKPINPPLTPERLKRNNTIFFIVVGIIILMIVLAKIDQAI